MTQRDKISDYLVCSECFKIENHHLDFEFMVFYVVK